MATDKTMREKIAEALWEERRKRWDRLVLVGDPKHWEPWADAILAISEIKEGQELREKAKSGKLVELDEDQRTPIERMSFMHEPPWVEQVRKAEREMLALGFRRVLKP